MGQYSVGKTALTSAALVLTVLIVMSVTILYAYSVRTSEIATFKTQLAHLKLSLNQRDLEQQKIGTVFPKLGIKRLESVMHTDDKARFEIYKFVSRYDCGTCLSEEARELGRIKASFKNIEIHVITVDSSRTTPLRYHEVCGCSFGVYIGGTSARKKVNLVSTPYIIMVSPLHQILATYYAEIGNARKRDEFYRQVKAILDSGVQ